MPLTYYIFYHSAVELKNERIVTSQLRMVGNSAHVGGQYSNSATQIAVIRDFTVFMASKHVNYRCKTANEQLYHYQPIMQT